MAASFYFYDLETSGFSPRDARIMQFAGQRTDMQLNSIGEPHNLLIRLGDDILPEPDAVLITGITPQQTISEGVHEAEFLKVFYEEIAVPDTIFVGFNTVRFDDEFMRYLMYRNFYDAYEWQWQNGRSRWDILDLVRITRALRPDGIAWPFGSDGRPTNRLELLTSLNKLDHSHAHDALSDVHATIAVARMIRDKQPKLFEFLLRMRDKKEVANLAFSGGPYVYTSGKYASEFEKTTVVSTLTEHPQSGVLVFDLRYDPTPFLKLDAAQIAESMRRRRDDPGLRLPVKTLKFNRCPAVAPLSVLDPASKTRLSLDPKVYMANFDKLQQVKKELGDKVLAALELLDKKLQARLLGDEQEVDARLYDDFFSNEDKNKMRVVRASGLDELRSLSLVFADDRLELLLPLYKARNYPRSMSDEERATWEQFKGRKLLGGGTESRAAKYFGRLSELAERKDLTDAQRYLLEELQLYGQSVLPAQDQ